MVEIAEDNTIDDDAQVDFGNWTDMSRLPQILHKRDIERFHVLHELIHLEMFFVDGYQIIAHYNNVANLNEVSSIEKKFKNIPEDYVTHKKINSLGYNPIKESWFALNNQINQNNTDLEVSVQLINAQCFSEFRQNYIQQSERLFTEVENDNQSSHQMATEVLGILNNIDYNSNDSYNNNLQLIIDILAPQYRNTIHPSLLIKRGANWTFNP